MCSNLIVSGVVLHLSHLLLQSRVFFYSIKELSLKLYCTLQAGKSNQIKSNQIKFISQHKTTVNNK